MKTYFKNFTGILYKLVILTIISFGIVYPQVVINPNGSFEYSDVTVGGDTSAVEGWTFNLDGTGDATFRIISDTVKDGNRALAVKVLSTGSSPWYVEALNDPLTIVPGETYIYAVWARANESGATAHFTVGGPPPNYTEYLRNEQNGELTTEWQMFTREFTVPANAESEVARGPIHFSFSENVGKTIYIDSLRITQITGTGEELDPIALGKDKFLGNVYSRSQLPRFTEYWNQVTPENAGKWGSVENPRDNMNWTELDAAYNLARENGFPFRFHVLIWGNQQPEWIETLPPNEQLEEIEEWFAAVAARYDSIDYVEVVNEPLHDPPNQSDEGGGNYIEALGGNGVTGWDWVITAFELAREYFPDSKLMINEYSIVNDATAANNYIGIINLLKERELIDGVGVQGHAFSTRVSGAVIRSNLNRLAATELPIQVTEMDVDGPTDQVQLDDYQKIFTEFWEHPSVEGVTLWGWKPGMWRTAEEAYIMTEAGEERPALEWLRAYVDTAMVSSIDIMEPNKLTTSYQLHENYPNPFNPETRISFEVPKTSHITLKIFDLNGRLVETLVDEEKQPGSYISSFNAGHLSSGVYFYRLQAGSFLDVKRMMLIK